MLFGLTTTRKARRIAVEAITAEIERVEALHMALRMVLPALDDKEMRADSARLNTLTRARIVVQDAFASKAEIRASK